MEGMGTYQSKIDCNQLQSLLNNKEKQKTIHELFEHEIKNKPRKSVNIIMDQ